jgi:glycosyltransferase involved in cell wall biosynthesis
VRVLYLAPNIAVPGTHGGSTHVAMVTEALRRRGHEVLLIARRGSHGAGIVDVGFGLAPVVQHLLPALYFARTLARVRRFRPDVIYERYSAFGLGVAFQRALSVPSVLMTLDRDASPVSLHFARRIVATSREFLPARYHPKHREVRWGVDPARFRAERDASLRAELAPGGERLVVYTGSFCAWHGLDLLVDVAAAWSGPPVRFVLVGQGEDSRRIERLVGARGLERRVVLTGRVPHERIPSYLAAADVCIAPYAPSRHPMFRKHGMNRDPIKVLEYLAAGKPTLTIDIPRIRTLFHDGEDVLLYEPDSATSLARALRAVLGDADLAQRLGRAGAALVERAYTWDRHAEDLERIFGEAIAEQALRR